jgi:hypothetical protein
MKPTARSCAPAICLLLINLCRLPAQAPPPTLNLVIVEGEGAINNVKDRVNREPIVQVEDENHKPIAGAAVVFFLPNQGPSGVFANGSKSLTLTTGPDGRAAASAIKRNNLSGQMQIRVTASFAGQTANAIITQTNVAAAAGAGGLSATAKLLIILGIAGAAAAAGAVIATRGGSSSPSSPPAAPPITITAGSPTVGAP